MKYLKVYTDFDEAIEPLGDAERGRLFTAMLEYAKQGTEPELRGNERFVWPTAKQNIDRQEEGYKNKVAGAEKAREARATSDIRANQNDNSDIRKKDMISSQDKDKDKDKDEEKKKRTIFAPPSVDEVRDYCQERHNTVNPQRFVAYYEARDWKMGKTPMKNWKAAVRTWENETDYKDGQPKKSRWDAVEIN